MHRFYVDKDAHGTGLAALLMHEVHRAANVFDGQYIWLGVWEQNARAIAFYKKSLFADVGETTFMVGPDRQEDRVLVSAVRL